MQIIKKDGSLTDFDPQKIISAVEKSANRAMYRLTDNDKAKIIEFVQDKIKDKDEVDIAELHIMVENALDEVDEKTAKAYRDYRNYKTDFVRILDSVWQKAKSLEYIGDVSNANTDSTLVATQRSLTFGQLNKELYQKFFLNQAERDTINDGYIYIHDMKDRLSTLNCCIWDMKSILDGGFECANVWYNEPKTLDVAFDVISDVTMISAAQNYGGFTLPEVDKLLAPYAEKSYQRYRTEWYQMLASMKLPDKIYLENGDELERCADEYAADKVYRDFEQGFQSWEYRFNTVGSSRGDYPFIACSFGIGQDRWEQMATETILKVRAGGQGKTGFKKPVLFPKLTFLYDENLHGEGKPLEYLFDIAIDCSSKSMYPDFLSLTGEGYIPSMYKKYGKVVSLMGCRASLSPWYVRGGMNPADEDDEPVFVGRANLGVCSLHLCMILAKAREENKDFYEVLDYYLEMIRQIHIKTYEFLGKKKASINPLAFCEGGFYKGNLKPDDNIAPVLKSFTLSFGITALNELQRLYNGKSIYEDGQFALEVMQYINDKVNQFKKEDGLLYAIYGKRFAVSKLSNLARGCLLKVG